MPNPPAIKKTQMYARTHYLPVCALLFAGCLSPSDLRPIAQRNGQNLTDYNESVARLLEEIDRSADLRISLFLHNGRKRVSDALVDVDITGLPATPTAADLAGPAKAWNQAWSNTQKPDVDAIIAALAGLSAEDTSRAIESLADRHPVLLDVALGDRTRSQVFTDVQQLEILNTRIDDPKEIDAIKEILHGQREAILDRYLLPKMRMKTCDDYRSAVALFGQVVQEQGRIASTHAESILAFADSKPALGAVQDVIQDDRLRKAVIGVIRDKKGERAAKELESGLGKMDRVIGIFANGRRP